MDFNALAHFNPNHQVHRNPNALAYLDPTHQFHLDSNPHFPINHPVHLNTNNRCLQPAGWLGDLHRSNRGYPFFHRPGLWVECG